MRDIASAIVKMVPDWPSGWIYRASSLTELNRHQEAQKTISEMRGLDHNQKGFDIGDQRADCLRWICGCL